MLHATLKYLVTVWRQKYIVACCTLLNVSHSYIIMVNAASRAFRIYQAHRKQNPAVLAKARFLRARAQKQYKGYQRNLAGGRPSGISQLLRNRLDWMLRKPSARKPTYCHHKQPALHPFRQAAIKRARARRR